MRPLSNPRDLGIIARSRPAGLGPPILLSVLDDFNRQGIAYCYWKSSRRLSAVLAGEGDVDLLVSRADQHLAQAILIKSGLKLFPSAADRDHPSVLSFLGFDEVSGQLIHLHLHFRLVVGERSLKNYRLPWEDTLLARTKMHPVYQIQILDPTSEALLLIVRSSLELRYSDPMTLYDWRAKARSFELDRQELRVRVDRIALRDVAAKLLSEDLAAQTADALFTDDPLEKLGLLRRRLRRHAKIYRGYNSIEMRARSLGRTVHWVAGKLNRDLLQAPRLWNRRAPGGGCIVAILGVDGSGKSTSVATMRSWLGTKIDVIPIYFGTGDGKPSFVLWPFKLILPLMLRILKSKPKGATRGKATENAPGAVHSALLAVWALAVALDKRAKLTTAARAANRGLIVLADRYPQDQISSYNDSPMLTNLRSVPEWLRRFERDVYARARRVQPDLIIKLTVTPETTALREPAMDRAVIPDRAAALQRLEFPGGRIVIVDAEKPLVEVIHNVKQEIWRLL